MNCAFYRYTYIRNWPKQWAEDFWFWLAWKLPRRLVYFCAVRVAAHATSGPYSDQVVPELRAMDAIKRWEETPFPCLCGMLQYCSFPNCECRAKAGA